MWIRIDVFMRKDEVIKKTLTSITFRMMNIYFWNGKIK
jgi:hypothetical protein